MGPARSIAPASPGLKNTCSSLAVHPHDWGIQCEQIVYEYYLKRNYRMLYSRYKILGVEVDWVFCDLRGLRVLVEVKSIGSFDFLETRLHPKQKARLLRVANFLSEKWDCRILAQLALVDRLRRVHIFDLEI